MNETERLDPSVWLTFIRGTELLSVRFPVISLRDSMDSWIPTSIRPCADSPLVFEPEVQNNSLDEERFLQARVPIEIRFETDDESGVSVLLIELTAQLTYRLKPGTEYPSSLVLEQFKKQAVYNGWPFLRQLVDDLLSRSGIRAPLLPLLLTPRFAKKESKTGKKRPK